MKLDRWLGEHVVVFLARPLDNEICVLYNDYVCTLGWIPHPLQSTWNPFFPFPFPFPFPFHSTAGTAHFHHLHFSGNIKTHNSHVSPD